MEGYAMYFRTAAVAFLLCLTVSITQAEDLDPNWAQNIVIRANKFAVQVHKKIKKKNVLQKKIDRFIPLDDFCITIDPINIAIGISFTF
jgi:hypothetical protein